MHVFVDESGNLGFSEKATKYFIVAYLECEKPERLRIELRRLLKRLHQKKQYPPSRNELKFSRMNSYCRKMILAKIAESDVSLGVVVLEKARVENKLRKDPATLYNWCVVHNIMLSLIQQIATGNKIQITFDKSLPKRRINEFNSYATNKASYLLHEKGTALPSNCITLNHIPSEKEFCLQAADAVAGAYHQKYENNNPEYAKIIEHKVSFFKYLWK
ncbi:MAG: DUF3800 domain-containing protein [Candidatus Bathyarchaeia archaeon]